MNSLGFFDVIRVSDGDTIAVDRAPMPEISTRKSLRLLSIDTEETQSPKDLGPITPFGKEVKKLAGQWFEQRENRVELKTEGLSVCGFYNRPLTQVFCQEEHYQQYAVAQGWTPYFTKYGYSENYHEILTEAEQKAQKDQLGIWSSELQNRPEYQNRPYQLLCKWWKMRAEQIKLAQEYKKQDNSLLILLNGVDYSTAMEKAAAGLEVQVFGAISRPHRTRKGGTGLFAIQVSMDLFFYLYVDSKALQRDKIIDDIEREYISSSRNLPDSLLKPNYVFVRGPLTLFRRQGNNIPEIIIHQREQISTTPYNKNLT